MIYSGCFYLSSYLDIAQKVLEKRRVPMGPHAILKDAYLLEFMPSHLHGNTQHKTLQARLSEDILHMKDRSRFVRTEPGKFFLRSLLSDETIPAEFRTTIKARRRKRELTPDPVLCIARESINKFTSGVKLKVPTLFDDLRKSGELSFFEVNETPADYVAIWSFAVFCRQDEVLTYRVGRYRADDDQVGTKRTLGFTSLVTECQQTLFNQGSLGIVEAGLTALALDLDFSYEHGTLEKDDQGRLDAIKVSKHGKSDALLIVFEALCPSWFEPTVRRLSMNDMQWMKLRVPPNHIEDFDPWSQAVVRHRFECDL